MSETHLVPAGLKGVNYWMYIAFIFWGATLGGEYTGPASETSARLDLSVLKDFLITIHSKRQAENFIFTPRERLSHYTDLGGLHGIVTNDDLWLTNCRFSNDDQEMGHGYTVAKKKIQETLATSEAERPYLEGLDKQLDPKTPDEVYVCCFCEENDRLSQWRGYGGNGVGVGVEFNGKAFAQTTGSDMPLGLMRLWKVYYDEEEQKELVGEAIQFGRSGVDLNDRIRRAADAIKFFIPTFKSRHFREEGEWRLIFTPSANAAVRPRFRAARQTLVPYYSLRELLKSVQGNQLTKLPIHHVLVGPNSRGRLTTESVKMMLAGSGYPHVTVEASDMPFRP